MHLGEGSSLVEFYGFVDKRNGVQGGSHFLLGLFAAKINLIWTLFLLNLKKLPHFLIESTSVWDQIMIIFFMAWIIIKFLWFFWRIHLTWFVRFCGFIPMKNQWILYLKYRLLLSMTFLHFFGKISDSCKKTVYFLSPKMNGFNFLCLFCCAAYFSESVLNKWSKA